MLVSFVSRLIISLSLACLWTLPTLALDLGAQQRRQAYEKCLKDSARRIKERWSFDEFRDFDKIINVALENSEVQAFDAFHTQLVEKMTGYPAQLPGKFYERRKTKKKVDDKDVDVEMDVFVHPKAFSRFNPKDWEDPEKRKSLVRRVCESYYQDLAEFCVHAFFKKEENLNEFLKSHENEIKQYAETTNRDSRSANPKQLLAGKDFKTKDQIGWSNLRLGQVSFSSADDYLFKLDPSNPMASMVFDKEGKPLGLVLEVTTEGQQELYFSPWGPRVGTVMNPYFFIFGGTKAKEWNCHWKKTVGDLYFQGRLLTEHC